jgi:acyl-CoA thioester hydrolase
MGENGGARGSEDSSINAGCVPPARRQRGDLVSEHSCALIVRSYECDAYGHVNNAVYLNYLEYARHAYLRDNGISIEKLRTEGYGLWVARLAIDYRRPAAADDPLAILTRPLRKSRVGGVLAQRIIRAGDAGAGRAGSGDTIAEAEVTWVCVDARGRPTRLPSVFDHESLSP